MIWLFATLGLWRCWLGGGIGKGWPVKSGLTYVQYSAALLIAFLATWHSAWPVTLVDGVGILALARWHGHGPMLQMPLKPDPDGDFLFAIADHAGSAESKWWFYAWLRYGLPGIVWAVALEFAGVSGEGPFFGSILIMATYRLTWALKPLPTMTTPGDETQNWAELLGWTALGVSRALFS